MAFYKWLPILAMTPLLYRSYYLVLVVPWGFTKLFDHYFERFFLWRHRNEKIINMRYEFVTKLSKERCKHVSMKSRQEGSLCGKVCNSNSSQRTHRMHKMHRSTVCTIKNRGSFEVYQIRRIHLVHLSCTRRWQVAIEHPPNYFLWGLSRDKKHSVGAEQSFYIFWILQADDTRF